MTPFFLPSHSGFHVTECSTSPRCCPTVFKQNSLRRRGLSHLQNEKSAWKVSPRNELIKAKNLQRSTYIQASNLQSYMSPEEELDSALSTPLWDIIGLGQGIIDYSASVSEDVLETLDVPKGGRRVISVEERGKVMEKLAEDGYPSQVSVGGSLANTLVDIARLSSASESFLNRSSFQVCMGASLGNDALGKFFGSQMQKSGVKVMSSATEHYQSHTGTVMVLTTEDAQRSFLSCFDSDQFTLPEETKEAILSSKCMVIEGYLWELPGAEQALSEAVCLARSVGCQVVLTAGDASVVSRHRTEILDLINLGVDILLANTDEALALLGPMSHVPPPPAVEAAKKLAAICPTVVVTDGSRGSVISALGQIHVIPPNWTPDSPVDTCGAGDAYAAGFLLAYLRGYGVRSAGEFGARVASAVIRTHNAQVSANDARMLIKALPVRNLSDRVLLQHL